MVEYCESIEEKLNSLGITIKKTDFDMQDASFQEDETELFNMVKLDTMKNMWVYQNKKSRVSKQTFVQSS